MRKGLFDVCEKNLKVLLGLFTCCIPTGALAHAGVYDRYLSALPSYNALISVPSGIFYCMHGLLLICILVYYLMHKFRGYNVPCIQIPRYNFHENILSLQFQYCSRSFARLFR